MRAKLFVVACGALLLWAVSVGTFLSLCEDDWCFVTTWQKVRAADSFERCVSLGFPVAESHPRQCQAGEKIFVEMPTTTPLPTSAANPSGTSAVASELIRVAAPIPNALVQSPITVSGEARGNWYFEASFPVRLLDANGNLLVAVPAHARGEWMTPEFVPFEATLAFATPKTETGTLVFAKDNPSGLPEHDLSVSVPVRFALHIGNGSMMRTVDLYYYNPKNDLDASGKAQCSSKGLVPLSRTMGVTKTPIADTIRLLLQGLISLDEQKAGVTTEYPLPGFEFTSASLKDGTLMLEFADPLHRSSGGACRSSLLQAQIEATARQFPGVNEVVWSPSDLFQP